MNNFGNQQGLSLMELVTALAVSSILLLFVNRLIVQTSTESKNFNKSLELREVVSQIYERINLKDTAGEISRCERIFSDIPINLGNSTPRVYTLNSATFLNRFRSNLSDTQKESSFFENGEFSHFRLLRAEVSGSSSGLRLVKQTKQGESLYKGKLKLIFNDERKSSSTEVVSPEVTISFLFGRNGRLISCSNMINSNLDKFDVCSMLGANIQMIDSQCQVPYNPNPGNLRSNMDLSSQINFRTIKEAICELKIRSATAIGDECNGI